jgi:RHS repeat-associated protein
MIPCRTVGNPLQNAVLVLCLMLSIPFSVNAHAAEEKVVGMEVVDGTGTSANSDTPLPDLFTGTMSYRIPIAVPPGRKGVDPGIVLTYRSTNGNGWLGVGWELEMGSIERNTKGGVNYDASDFLLRGPGGTTELVEISSPGASPREYRAKIEGSFIRVVMQDGYWIATDKKGVRFFFGQVDETRLRDPSDSTRVFKWCLDRIEDPNGNYVTFNYTQDQNQLYLNEINYTGNNTLPTTNSVKFILYDTRSDAPTMYTTKFAVTTAKLLKSIEVYANGSTLVRAYDLTYNTRPDGQPASPITGRSLLGKITEYGSDRSTAKPPIILQYSQLNNVTHNLFGARLGNESGEWDSTLWNGLSTQLPLGNQCIPGDFDGNGMQDIACYSGTSGIWNAHLSAGYNWINQTWNDSPTGLPALNMPMWKQCLSGDFKGEGKTGIACHLGNGGDWAMALPTDGVWHGDTWENGPTAASADNCFIGDFDGNGKTDITCYTNVNNVWQWQMALSTGSGWTNGWSGGPTYANPSSNCLTGDFNGDGKTDFACNNDSSWSIYLSTGNGWNFTPWGSGIVGVLSEHCRTGDFNGDGKTDIACYTGDDWSVALSTGNSWDAVRWPGGPTPNIPLYKQCVTGDFNGDGRSDIACYVNTTGWNWNVSLSTGNGWQTPRIWPNGPAMWDYATNTLYPVNQNCFALDIDGDGKTDLACYLTGGFNSWVIAKTFMPITDLLTSISNGLGGTVYLEYTPSTHLTNTQLPFPVQVLSGVAVFDGSGNISITKYDYSGGYYHAGTKDFRGFNHVKVSGPVGPNGEQTVTETWFHQGNGALEGANGPSALVGYMKGKPYFTRVSDGQGSVYSETEMSYYPPDPATLYYFTPLQWADTYVCDGNATGVCKGSGAARRALTGYAYDGYGNVTLEYRYGDAATPSNPLLNMTIERQFSPNTSDWIVSLPKSESIFQGIGNASSGNQMVRQTNYYYDGVTDCSTDSQNQTPTKGNLTRVSRWLNSNPASYTETRMAYDDYGNPRCTRDPNGNITTIGFDDTFKTFPTSSTTPTLADGSSLTTTSTYYGVGTATDKGRFGQLKSVYDPNDPIHAIITSEYDVFGRKTKDIQPDNFWTSTAYNSFGTVGNQNVYVYNQLGMWSASYFDGLGRTFKERKSGPDNKIIVTETAYDQRGKVSRVSVPYFEGAETPLYKTFTYDPMGRVKQVTNPDTTSTLACYNDLVSVFIDENGHRRRETRDPLGRLVTVEEYEGTYSNSTCDTLQPTPYATTTYAYDVLGNLTDVIDANQTGVPVANQKKIHIEYDTLGRKKNMTDPDMGYWEYGYYPDGSLYSVKDANQKTITFDLDVLNRVRAKHYPAGSGATDVIYTYDETTSSNPKGRLTTMTDGSGKSTYNYDLSGRVTRTVKRVDNIDYSVTKAYDGMGRLKNIIYPDNEEVGYAYDAAGNLSEVNGYAEYDEYNALGQPGKLYYGNGIVTSYWYYPKNYRLFAMKADQLQTSLLYRTYSYDNKGNVAGVNDLVNPPIPHNVVYGSVGYTLDPNRAHAVQTASTIPGRVYQYDNNGNMKSDGLRTVTYTPDNLPNDITIGAAKTSFTYDGNGTRVKKAYGGMTRVYIDKLYDSYDGDSDNYIYAGNTRIALHWTNVPTQQDGTVYYHPDHLGSTSIVTDDNGNKVEDIFYYSFGETRQDTGSGNLMHKYTGQELDYEANLYNYGARLYDPEIGRFISPDSIVPYPGNPQSLNRYAYVQNNPVNRIDPTGNIDFDENGNMSFATQDAIDIGDSLWNDTTAAWESGDYLSAAGNAALFALNGAVNLPASFAFDATIGAAYNAGVNSMAGITRGDWNTALQGSVGLLTLGAGAKFSTPSATISTGITTNTETAYGGIGSISNPIPEQLARIIPGEGNFTTLGPPAISDVFVTAADDIAGMNATQIANRLTIAPSNVLTVFEFPTPPSGLASPVFRNNPGFVGGGLTAGGAREFVIPNGPIPSNAIRRVVGP